jgi:hypothetical protein
VQLAQYVNISGTRRWAAIGVGVDVGAGVDVDVGFVGCVADAGDKVAIVR